MITNYHMGFEVTPDDTSSRVRVFIDFELPPTALQSWLGRLFGGAYARWCIARMVADASDFKGQSDAPSKPQSGSSSP